MNTYTSEEIVNILERAKALGITFLKLDGFEASFGVQPTPARAFVPAPVVEREEKNNVKTFVRLCRTCGQAMELGKFGKYYCKPCYIDRKEAKK